MTPEENTKSLLKAASEKLLATSEGAILEWTHDGSEVLMIELYSVQMIGSPAIQLRSKTPVTQQKAEGAGNPK